MLALQHLRGGGVDRIADGRLDDAHGLVGPRDGLLDVGQGVHEGQGYAVLRDGEVLQGSLRLSAPQSVGGHLESRRWSLSRCAIRSRVSVQPSKLPSLLARSASAPPIRLLHPGRPVVRRAAQIGCAYLGTRALHRPDASTLVNLDRHRHAIRPVLGWASGRHARHRRPVVRRSGPLRGVSDAARRPGGHRGRGGYRRPAHRGRLVADRGPLGARSTSSLHRWRRGESPRAAPRQHVPPPAGGCAVGRSGGDRGAQCERRGGTRRCSCGRAATSAGPIPMWSARRVVLRVRSAPRTQHHRARSWCWCSWPLLLSTGLYVARGVIRLPARPGATDNSWRPGVVMPPEARQHIASLAAAAVALLAIDVFFDRYEMLYQAQRPVHRTGLRDPVRHAAVASSCRPSITAVAALARVPRHQPGVPRYNGPAGGRAWSPPRGVRKGALPEPAAAVSAWTRTSSPVRPRRSSITSRPRVSPSTWTTSQELSLSGKAVLSRDDIDANQPTIRNVRLWDHEPLLDTFSQVQEIRTYYEFESVHNDRYMVDGELAADHVVAAGARRGVAATKRRRPGSTRP